MHTELVILGAGPAGLTAGLYAARARIPLLILEKALPGGQMTATELVDNYPGFADPIYGVDLAQVRRLVRTHDRITGAIYVQGRNHSHRGFSGEVGHPRRTGTRRQGGQLLRGL
jgi:thioredoxin reductase